MGHRRGARCPASTPKCKGTRTPEPVRPSHQMIAGQRGPGLEQTAARLRAARGTSRPGAFGSPGRTEVAGQGTLGG